MGSAGRPLLFDLNELPPVHDDCDEPSPHPRYLEGAQSSPEHVTSSKFGVSLRGTLRQELHPVSAASSSFHPSPCLNSTSLSKEPLIVARPCLDVNKMHPSRSQDTSSGNVFTSAPASHFPVTEIWTVATSQSDFPKSITREDDGMKNGEERDFGVSESLGRGGKVQELEVEEVSNSEKMDVYDDDEAETTQRDLRGDGLSLDLQEKLQVRAASTVPRQTMEEKSYPELKTRGEDNSSLDEADKMSDTEFAAADAMLEFGNQLQERGPVAKDLEMNEGYEASKGLDLIEGQEDGQYGSAPIDVFFRALKSEASQGSQIHADAKLSLNVGKTTRSELKDVILGKKRSRQTMFLDVGEAVRQAGPLKTSKKSLSSYPSRIMKDGPRTPPAHSSTEKVGDRVLKPKGSLTNESGSSGSSVNLQVPRKDSNVSVEGLQSSVSECLRQSQLPKRSTQLTSDNITNGLSPSLAKKYSGNQGDVDEKQKQIHSLKPLGRKQMVPGHMRGLLEEQQMSFLQRPLAKRTMSSYRKHGTSGKLFHSHDTSIERLHREATCDKLWRLSPGDPELQSVPDSFESVEEYVQVFEPLLFEECRAQLNSTWTELNDAVSKDAHMAVTIKNIEKRERGWYDLVLLPSVPHFRLTFKEGDVAVLSSPKPGSASGKFRRQSNGAAVGEAPEAELSSQTAGIVRRYLPVDTRDPHGAILHFHLGESSIDPTSEDHAFKRFQGKGAMWYLTVLGSLATTQREYVALHGFQRLHSQMIEAILHPKADLFPRHEEEPPVMLDCFTQSFLQHLNSAFNGPQLAAIKWAAMHTAAGTTSSNGLGKRQDLWPFTLVQGPPGTGKTHTVWGMLNVIHLVQYQRYYAALLKKLAPDSLKSTEESATQTSWPCAGGTGSIDEVLQKMDQSLARVLPKLCPKPRLLVCAPSNAATDEMLTRVLDRGFIDGEMKIYHPDVARVGSDTQSRAAQAVSVERRSDQLLGMRREDVMGWLQQLHTREAALAQQIACLQKELSVSSAAARSQGTVGVDREILAAREQSRDSRLQQLAAVVEERDKVLVEMSRLFIVEARFRSGNGFSPEGARSKLEASFANEAEIVFTTVSSSGRRLFNNLSHGFDMVVIDEAAQASEVAVLPPLSLGAARCVLVGDPQQLPATVISRAAGTLRYSRSLFERFQQAGCPTLLLSVQYRMHPQIRDFPSRYFYQGRLVDSESVSTLPDEVYHQNPLLRPYLFYDVSHGRESHKGGSVSYQNILEAQFSARLYEHLQNSIKAAGISKVSVGIVTPYKLQLKCLRQEFQSVLGSDAESKGVYINTVDAFQGQERDVIMMSCVRASSHGVGFVADIRRMNVALTRARRSLWIMGNAAALVQSEDWAALIADAKERGCFVSMAASAAKGLIASKSNTFVPTQGRAPGLLRIPRPPGLIKGGPQDLSTDANFMKGNANRRLLGGAKNGTDRDPGQSTGPNADWMRQPHSNRDPLQTSQSLRSTVDQPILGFQRGSAFSARFDRSSGKHIQRKKGL